MAKISGHHTIAPARPAVQDMRPSLPQTLSDILRPPPLRMAVPLSHALMNMCSHTFSRFLQHTAKPTGHARAAGTIVGQAAWFDTYTLEDGTVVNCGAGADAEAAEATPEALAEAEAAVEEQGVTVRALKEQEGMTNKSPEVQACPSPPLRAHPRGPT